MENSSQDTLNKAIFKVARKCNLPKKRAGVLMNALSF